MKKDWQEIFNAIGLLTQLGLIMVADIAVGFFLGKYVGGFFNESLVSLVMGIMLGIASGFYTNYKLIKKNIINNKQKQNKNKKDDK